MNLYIRIRDGQPLEHPILEENAHQAWPDVNFALLPDWLARFRRHPQPAGLLTTPFQKAQCTYTLAGDGFWEDTWTAVEMSAEEQQVLTRQRVKEANGQRNSTVEFAQAEAAKDGIPAEAVAAWNTFVAELQALEITDPFNITWPTPPHIASDGYPVV
jgi:hypothetical protein